MKKNRVLATLLAAMITAGGLLSVPVYAAETAETTVASEVQTQLTTPKATTASSLTKVKVQWKKVNGALGYKVYRSTKKSSGYKAIATVTGCNKVAYTDSSVNAGKTYYYKVQALGTYTAQNSKNSAAVAATARLSTPEVTAKSASSTSIKLTWKKVSGATGYTVYRAASKNGKYTKLTATTSLSYTDKKVTSGKTYYYKVVATGKQASYKSAAGTANAAAVHTHKWQNTYKTVSRPATYTTVSTPTYGWEYVRVCDNCKKQLAEDEWCDCYPPGVVVRQSHREAKFVQVDTETYKVKNTEAYTAKVKTGRKCTTCGKTEKTTVDYAKLDKKHHVHDYVEQYKVVYHEGEYEAHQQEETVTVAHDACNGCGVYMENWTTEQRLEHGTNAREQAFENFKRLSGSDSYLEYLNTYANGNGAAHGYPDDYNLYCGGYHSEYTTEKTGKMLTLYTCTTPGTDEEIVTGYVCTICGHTKK